MIQITVQRPVKFKKEVYTFKEKLQQQLLQDKNINENLAHPS